MHKQQRIRLGVKIIVFLTTANGKSVFQFEGSLKSCCCYVIMLKKKHYGKVLMFHVNPVMQSNDFTPSPINLQLLFNHIRQCSESISSL